MPITRYSAFLYRTLLLLSISGLLCSCQSNSLLANPLWETSEGGVNKKKAYHLVTGDEEASAREQWNKVFENQGFVFGKKPAQFLAQHLRRIPVGRALDIAMGEGRNAVYLAKKGFHVLGVDISDVAIRKSHRLAREHQVAIKTTQADLNRYKIDPGKYELIVNINYLQRSLIPQIKRGLKKGGYVVFENHTIDHINNPDGASMPREYLLEKGELRKLFSDLEIIVYRETNDGKNAVASLIARKN